MSGELLEQRQHDLVRALLSRSQAAGLAALPGVGSAEEDGVARGLRAYRQNAQSVSARALASVFAGVEAALGADDFAAMAWAFWREYPPQHGDLATWGADLPSFFEAQDGMEPWLPDLARLEWAQHACERAADAELDGPSLNLLGEVPADQIELRFRPGLVVLDVHPGCLDGGESVGPNIALLVWRQAWRAKHRPLLVDEARLFRALLAGDSLQDALDGVMQSAPQFDFGGWLTAAVRDECLAGAFQRAIP